MSASEFENHHHRARPIGNRRSSEYYEERRPSAGVKFWIEFKVLAKRLKSFPEIYSRFGNRGIRKAPMHYYPHVVYYRIAGDELRILGVVHGAVNPEKIKIRFG